MGLLAALDEDRALHQQAELRVGQWFAATVALSTALRACADGSFEGPMVAATVFTWFTVVRVARGKPAAILVRATPWLALALPAMAILVVARSRGAEAALGQWLPPLLVALMLALSVLRLEPWRPLAYSSIVAATYAATYAWLTGAVDVALLHRAMLLLGMGTAFSFVARGWKNALGRAEKRVLFGKYRLGDPIAAGGMASVVRATYCPESGFERPVAIKRMHAHVAAEPRFVDAFRREAEIGARLAHPNIVAVLDFGAVDDTWFLAMEHVEGIDLRALLGGLRRCGRRLPPRLAGLIVYEVLQGLAFAHGAARDKDGRLLRVVHRDLTPANVMIARTGDVKIADFGIACALLESDAYQTRRVMGSVGYLAPEQAAGEAFDHRADVFAAGVLLWEMLAGKRLWARATDRAVMLAIENEEAPPLGRAGWDQIVSKALAKDPAARYSGARAMADAVAAHIIAELGALPHPDELAAFVTLAAAARGDEEARSRLEAVERTETVTAPRRAGVGESTRPTDERPTAHVA